MRYDLIDQLILLCKQSNSSVEMIENFLRVYSFNETEVTIAATRFTDELGFGKIICNNLPEQIKLFLKYGLNPNQYFDSNIMHNLWFIENGFDSADAFRILLEHGGDLNLDIHNETLFELIDWDMVFDVLELSNENLFNSRFHMWLVGIGYGGKIKNGILPVVMKNGYEPQIFKEHELFDYEIEYLKRNWILHILKADSREEMAYIP